LLAEHYKDYVFFLFHHVLRFKVFNFYFKVFTRQWGTSGILWTQASDLRELETQKPRRNQRKKWQTKL